ncbi:uncharacterized protein RJT20DRAFT_27818 [Scheffersomyces xylosifermentans]|uniref:uncharacterized protein n=1 Tax=Scheffersomyces xylosifermentans TaxID=1304137 RepID=UPI00315C9A24
MNEAISGEPYDYKNYSDEEFDETGFDLDANSSTVDGKTNRFSAIDELKSIVDRSTKSLERKETPKSSTKSPGKYTQFRSRNRTPLRRPPINSSSFLVQQNDSKSYNRGDENRDIDKEKEKYGEEDEDAWLIRENVLVSPVQKPRGAPGDSVIRSRYSSAYSSPSSMKFNNILGIGTPKYPRANEKSSSPVKANHNEEEEFESSEGDVNNYDSAKSATSHVSLLRSFQHSDKFDGSVTKSNDSVKAKLLNAQIDSSQDETPTYTRINGEISRDSIIEKVNNTLHSLNNPTKRYKTINPETTSTPKTSASDSESHSSPSESIHSHFIDDFLSKTKTSQIGKSLSTESLGSDLINREEVDVPSQKLNSLSSLRDKNDMWWPAEKWLKLNKIVKSRDISRADALDSVLLRNELQCTRKELAARYDFMINYKLKKRQFKRKNARVSK